MKHGRLKKAGIVVTAALLGLVPTAGAAQRASAAQPRNHSGECRPGSPVDQSGYVAIGGIRQWVTIKGRDCANPIVLIVHGGPGNPNTPFAEAVYGGWTGAFTLVQWDQRGSGMTFSASPPGQGEHLTIERLTQDGLEVTRHALRRLGKRRVILMGGSWGSALAVHMAQAQPNLFSAYVGTSQFVDYDEELRASYGQTLSRARAAGDQDSVAKLEGLGPPPWTNPRAFGALRRVTRIYEALSADAAPPAWFRQREAGYDTPAHQQAYEAGEDYSYLEFVGLSGDGIGSRIDLRRLGTRFRMPVIMLQGDEDLVTPPVVSRAYFEGLTAPHKTYIRLPRTGHDPNRTMVDAQFQALLGLRAGAIAANR
jgi:pimeloyl-ACP methyl ester carboxylesterase